MNDVFVNNKTGLLLLGLSLAIGLVVSTLLVTGTMEKLKLANEKITVKGFAEKRITSDVAVWKCEVVARSSSLKTAYDKLAKDVAKVLSYLREKGINDQQMDISSVSTRTRYKKNEQGYNTSEIEGYVFEQSIKINSDNVALIATLARESTSLIKEGIEFVSLTPEYYSAKFNEIKIDLIGEATANARTRAEQFARNSGIKVGDLKSATQGVFQVTPVHSTETSGYGMYDTSTIEKSVKAVVTIEYSIRKK